MNEHQAYEHLHFDRRIPAIPRPLIAIGGALTLFTVAWIILPKSILYLLLIVALTGLVWVASFGWQEALHRLIAWLQRLESGW